MQKNILLISLIVILLAPSVIFADCQGRCGDTNADGKVNISDVVHIIRFVFNGGPAPAPVLACGDANSDAKVGVSDAIYILNHVFSGGSAPTDCAAGHTAWGGNDCCPY